MEIAQPLWITHSNAVLLSQWKDFFFWCSMQTLMGDPTCWKTQRWNETYLILWHSHPTLTITALPCCFCCCFHQSLQLRCHIANRAVAQAAKSWSWNLISTVQIVACSREHFFASTDCRVTLAKRTTEPRMTCVTLTTGSSLVTLP